MAVTALLDLRLKSDSLEASYAILRSTLEGTRAFPGNLGVTVLVDSADPAHVVVHETWESQERDQAYREWRRSPEGASELRTVVAEPPKVTKFTVAEDI